jgi:hypothetical protein
MNELRAAAYAGDAERLGRSVDFPVLRENLKVDLRSAASDVLRDGIGDVWAAAAAGLTGVLVDPVVETYVTPASLAALARGRDPRVDREGEDLEFAIERRGLSEFLARFDGTGGLSNGGLLFRRQGLRWRLVRIVFPDPRS